MTKTVTSIDEIQHFLTTELDGVIPTTAWGETSFFYNPGQMFERGTYFATIKEKDGENDKGSNLDRPGIWRLNFGVKRPTFEARFGKPPARPAKGQIVKGPWDFTELDRITPHPVYGWMSWMAVLCPSPATFTECRPLIIDAHQKASALFEKRVKAAR